MSLPWVAGVAVDRAAQRAGDGDQRFQAGEPFVGGGGDDQAEFGAAAGGDRVLADVDLAKCRGRKPDDHAGNALVADEDIRSPAQEPHRHLFFVAPPDQGHQFIDACRLGKELGRPPSWNQVCMASGSSGRTNFSSPLKKPISDLLSPSRHFARAGGSLSRR